MEGYSKPFSIVQAKSRLAQKSGDIFLWCNGILPIFQKQSVLKHKNSPLLLLSLVSLVAPV